MSDVPPAVVLVVEDEPALRLLSEEILAEYGGYEVISAAHAGQALAILSARQEVRLVFTDTNMPGANMGLDLALAVKANWPGTGVLLPSGAPP
ncbi:response regulator, partial [Salinarimonas soli]|uniref:response regulator n=1 Tax=Salinarimonas soli TaxID=1638099 RepID=UPI001661F3E2